MLRSGEGIREFAANLACLCLKIRKDFRKAKTQKEA
jgi:hypothetical protein